ncbi:MAG: histidinol-phosphate transaminase [Cellulomonadaceae bacterium]|nr:histidinol-phosphate transaminase [Cellulomonadaceae bacterium]
MNTRLPIRPELRGESPYGAPQLDVPVQLNVNENPYAPPSSVVTAIANRVTAAATHLNRYPDRDFTELRHHLAAYLRTESGVTLRPEQIWAANGSNEVMLHLFSAFGGPDRTAASFTPTYSMYPEYARDTHTQWVTAPRRSDFTIDDDAARTLVGDAKPSLIVLASPNNPTGTALPLSQVAALCEAAPDAVIVIDEAYGEFRSDGTPSALELLNEHPNLAVTRTMSKAFAAAGLRLGYLAASQELVDVLRIVRLPYHLSAVTQAAALAALDSAAVLQEQVAAIRAERDATVAWLKEQGYRVPDTDANFALFGPHTDRHAVWQGLLDRGVLIRETGPDSMLRVSIGTPQEMARFKEALLAVTKEP